MNINVLAHLTRAEYRTFRECSRRTKSGINLWVREFGRTPNRLEEREELAQEIKAMAVNGKVPVYEWGRDCDMCESDSAYLIPANVMAFERRECRVYDGAEGATSFRLMHWDNYKDFHPSFRDRIGEAWDNGNTSPHYV